MNLSKTYLELHEGKSDYDKKQALIGKELEKAQKKLTSLIKKYKKTLPSALATPLDELATMVQVKVDYGRKLGEGYGFSVDIEDIESEYKGKELEKLKVTVAKAAKDFQVFANMIKLNKELEFIFGEYIGLISLGFRGISKMQESKDVKIDSVIKAVIDAKPSKDNAEQGKFVQLLKGLAFSDEPKATEFMSKLMKLADEKLI